MKIMLDAGHDIDTAGKRSPDESMREFQFNKVVVEFLKIFLEKYEDVSILLSHDLNDKIDTSLEDRTNYANREKVDCFISVHANAGPTTARGIETFVHPNSDKFTQDLGLRIHNHTVIITNQKNRGLKSSDFWVLRKTNMPAVLIECGFMTNKFDLNLLKSYVYREKCALGILNGIVETYNLKKKVIDKPIEKIENKIYRVITGSFRDKDNAEQTMKKLKDAGFDSFIEILK